MTWEWERGYCNIVHGFDHFKEFSVQSRSGGLEETEGPDLWLTENITVTATALLSAESEEFDTGNVKTHHFHRYVKQYDSLENSSII